MRLPPVVALEIGTSNVRAVVGEARENQQIMITGIGQCESRGVRKGEIINFDNALACVHTALEQAEEQADVNINEVHLVITGDHIKCLINRGNVPVLSPDGEITDEDKEQVMDMARAVSLPPERAIIHTIGQHYYVDDQEGVADPEGMGGAKLALDMLILHGIRNRVKTSVRVLRSVHVEVQDVAFSGLCTGLAVLTPEQKENGVIVLDLGGGTTDFLVYANRAIACAGSLAVGGDHITNDLALGLKIPMAQAEWLKREAGSALFSRQAQSQNISLAAEGGFPGKFVKESDVNLIINARMDETLSMLKDAIAEYDVQHMIGAGVVLTGGGSHLAEVKTLVEKVFDLPCHEGIPRNISGLAIVTEGPDYAAPLGMIRYAIKTGSRKKKRSLMDVVLGRERKGFL